MTAPFPPQQGPHDQSGQPIPPGQYPGPGQPYLPPQPGYGLPPAQRNTIGLIALVTAVIGFIFACIPGALIVGWILLPIAFILGIVGLFAAAPKATAITAVALAVVGTVVGVVVFFTLVAESVEEAFGTENVPTLVEDGASTEPNADTDDKDENAVGSRSNPAKIGTAMALGDWEITLNGFQPDATAEVLAANSFNDPPKDGYTYGLADITVKYTGADSATTYDLSFDYITSSGNVLKSYDNDAVTPEPQLDGELYAGATLTGNVDFEIPADDTGLIRVKISLEEGELFFSTR